MEQWIQVLSARMPEFENVPRRSDFASDEEFSEALFVTAKRKEMRGEVVAAREIFRKALKANPVSSLVSLALGLLESNMETSIPGAEQLAARHLGAATSPFRNRMPPIEGNSMVAYKTTA